MLSFRIQDNIHLELLHDRIIKAAEGGVTAATQDGVTWIREDVIRNGIFVGDEYYPDVSPSTKRIKMKKGKHIVLKDSGAYLASWNGTASGLKGVISGASGLGYARELYERGWKIDKLFEKYHAKKANEIIREKIQKVI